MKWKIGKVACHKKKSNSKKLLKLKTVKLCNSIKQRSLLAHFRSGILPYISKLGDTTLNVNMLMLCNTSDIENEFHFLCTCNIYCNLRKGNCSQNNDNFPNMNNENKFIYLIKYEGKIASYVYIEKPWNMRNYIVILYKNTEISKQEDNPIRVGS